MIIIYTILCFSMLVAEEKIIPSDGNIDDRFGKAVSITESWLAIGANRDDDTATNSGSVYLYKYENNTILDEYKITSFDAANNDYFGKALAINEQWLAISSLYDDENGEKSGSAYVYHLENNQWTFHTKILPYDGAPFDRFGYSIDIENDLLVIGSVYDDDFDKEDSGSIYVYRLLNNEWVFDDKLYSNDIEAGDFFGTSVSINNGVISVGAVYDDFDNYLNCGSVTVFNYINNQWSQLQKIYAYDLQNYDFFGNSIDMHNNKIIIGSFRDDADYLNSGSAYLYKFINNQFENILKITAYDESLNDNFGQSVAIYNDFLAIGSLDDDNGINSGSVYIYQINDDQIIEEIKYIGDDVNTYDEFSGSLSLYNNHLLVGSQYDDDLGDASGSAYLLNYIGCQIESACNYESSFFHDQSLCFFSQNNFNCDGTCEFSVDECGVCSGGGNNGNINYDEDVNIVDLVIIVDYILDNNEIINQCVADLNNDFVVNVTDIILLIEAILYF